MRRHLLGMVTVAMLWPALPAVAQSVIGPVSWQLQPYCNVVTLTLTSSAAGFRLEGTDDLCGASNKGSAVGVASPNNSGNYTLNFTIVTAPSGKPVHVSAVVSPGTGSGTWSDSLGNGGTFAFFGSAPGLPARPFPASGLPPSVITTTEIAPGAVGASDINSAEVQARVSEACSPGFAISSIMPNGTVTCAAALPSDVRFKANSLTPQTIATGNVTITGWGSTTAVGGTYDSATGAFTVPVSGVYLVAATVALRENSPQAGNRCVLIHFDTAVDSGECQADAAMITSMSATTVASLPAGTAITIRVQNNTGASTSVTDAAVAQFSVVRLR